MVCGGFTCSKNCLCALNLLYTVSSCRPSASASLGGPRVSVTPPLGGGGERAAPCWSGCRLRLPQPRRLQQERLGRRAGSSASPLARAPPEPAWIHSETAPPCLPRGASRDQQLLLPVQHLQLVSLLLIGIAAWGIGFGLISSFRVVGVVVAVGIFLFLIALVGLIGAVKHHQVLLFFYMIILLLVFIVQFSVSCACLALNKDQQRQLLEVGWNNTKSAREDIERNLNCCGFKNFNSSETCSAACVKVNQCVTCESIIEEYSGMVLRFVGGIGLFFSFTEILGVWLTYRYRNQKDSRANPSAFL